MAKINENLISEMQRIILNCTEKRELLLKNAVSKSRTKKTLTIMSGILALISAGAITSVIIKYFGNNFLQIVSAITATLSGIISIVLTVYYPDENSSKTFEGAAKYLLLRDKAYRFLLKPNNSNPKFYEDLTIIQNEYSQLDEPYSKYLYVIKFRFRFLSLFNNRYTSRSPILFSIANIDNSMKVADLERILSEENKLFNERVSKLDKDGY